MDQIRFKHYFYFMILSFLTSCLATSSLNRSDYRISHYNREFYDSGKNDSLVAGTFVGLEKISGRDFYHLQFDSFLVGKHRNLDFYLPAEPYQGKPVIRENRAKAEKGQQVLGCVTKYFSMDENTLRHRLFYPTMPVTGTPDTLLMEKMGIAGINQAPDPFIALELDLSNVFESKINTLVWKKDSLGNWGGERYHYIPLRPDNWFEPKVKWKKRSRVASVLIKPLYLLTGLVDLVTLPIQYFLLKGMVK